MLPVTPFTRTFTALALTLSLAACTSVTAQDAVSPAAQTSRTALVVADTGGLIPEGWRETVLSVSNLEEMVAFYTDVLDWEVRSAGMVDRALLDAWGLPASASARYTLVGNPNTERGFVRILDFGGVDQVRIRSHDQAWESGGIYNMNIRVSDMAATSQKITDAGWQAPSAPVNFTFGPFIVWEWIPRHKDGVRVAIMERVKPILTDWPNLKTASRTFNSTQIVSDMEKTLAFYQGVLGFSSYLESRSASAEPADHVLGLSREAMTRIVRDVLILNPGGSNEGSVEVLAFEGYSGRDFSSRSMPPNLGNLMLRYRVPDADSLATYLSAKGVSTRYGVVKTTVAPYGQVKILAIQSPDGAWLEFFEVL